MESKACNVTARTASNEVPAVDLSADAPKPSWRLSPLGYERLVRIRASLHWLKGQASNSAHQDMFAAYLKEIDALLEKVVIVPSPDRCAPPGL